MVKDVFIDEDDTTVCAVAVNFTAAAERWLQSKMLLMQEKVVNPGFIDLGVVSLPKLGSAQLI